jgi:hypothetical protein
MWYNERLNKNVNTSRPKFSLCCSDGKVELPVLKQAPKILQDLHTNKDAKSRHFLKHLRSFNAMFAFTSMAGKIDHSFNKGTSPPIFRIGGQNYHSIGSLIPSSDQRPKFSQLYIYDTENEVDNRIHALRYSISTIVSIHNMLSFIALLTCISM